MLPLCDPKTETTLPMDWPPLREAAKAEAQRLELEMYGGAPGVGVGALLKVALRGRLANLSLPASRDHWVRWLAEQVGLTVGATAPGWTYTAENAHGSVATWQLSCGGRRWALCDYPSDIERALGAPRVYEGMISVRNLPTDPAAALRAALLCLRPQ